MRDGADENAAVFIRAGAAAVGVGSHLVDRRLLATGDLDMIRQRAAALMAAVAGGREVAQ